MVDKDELVMRFDPNTIEHLGVKMYSQIPTAIAELVANAYDAAAKNVFISLYDGDVKKIVVEDDGIGMTFNEINDYFLLIGRNRRKEGQTTSLSGKRKVTGKKGLGKLALFGIGDTIEIFTVKDGEATTFRMNWNELKNTNDSNYKPTIVARTACAEKTGTKITLSDLKRKSPFDEKGLAVSLSKLFNFFDSTFKVTVQSGDIKIDVNNELKYANLVTQFEFVFPANSEKIDFEYEYKKEIEGQILTTEKPLKPGLRGITLFANGRLVNASEFFGRSESSHFYSYVTGWLNVNFVDNWDNDVISTNRQSLNWDLDITQILRVFLQKLLSWVQKDWREKRNIERQKKLAEKTKIDIPSWYEKLPDDIKPRVASIVDSIEKSELISEEQVKAIENMHMLIPEYPYYHWRHLHPDVQSASEIDYNKEDYYRAFLESVKRYITGVRAKSGSSSSTDHGMMGQVFGHLSTLSVCHNFIKPDGSDFQADTKKSIEEGQKYLSMGLVSGARNPLSHEEIVDLRDSDLFTEKDCLDMLSLLSHLCKRLENSERLEIS